MKKSLESIKESLKAAIRPMAIYALWGLAGTAFVGVYFFAPGAITFGQTALAALWPALAIQAGLTVLQGFIHNYFYENGDVNKTKQSVLASVLSNISATILGATLSMMAPIVKKNLIFLPGMLILGAKSMPYLYGLTLILEAGVGLGVAFAHYSFIHEQRLVSELGEHAGSKKRDAFITNNSKWIDSLYFGVQAYLGMKVGFYGATNSIRVNNAFFDKMGETALGQSSFISNASKKFFEWAAPSLINTKMPLEKQTVFMVFSTGVSRAWQAGRGFCPKRQ